MTTEETKQYLKNYKNMMHRIEYIDNKLINVKSIPYDDSSVGSYAEPKTNNDYIMMKDKYLKEMSSIRASVESIEDMTLRDVLFYRYIECLEISWIVLIHLYLLICVMRLKNFQLFLINSY